MLETISNINDLKRLSVHQLPQLCNEIRQLLIETIPTTGGHLSSNLGVVELSVVLHYVFDFDDKIIWDVGHQSYVHKILTGRKEELYTLRQQGGLSGFCDPNESPSDSVISGHASTSISSALGIATARDLQRQCNKVVAVIGDGALTGGMVYEALNNIRNTNMLIILNDNNMSIDKNVGALSKSISRLRVGKYYKNKQRIKRFLCKIPLIGKPLYKFCRWIKRHLKFTFLNTTYFDHYKVKYIGIIDGNEIKDLYYYLSKIKSNINEPTVLHIITQKGKGYPPAETDQILYHNYPESSVSGLLASQVVGDILVRLADSDESIVAITAAMKPSVGLTEFCTRHPYRFFDVGIAEGHAVTFAGGMASNGIRPYVLIYSTFLQRAYDQIIHDVAIADLPVTFLLDRAGFVGHDGKTHQGLQDLSYLGSVPNMTVWTPFCNNQLQQMLLLSPKFNRPLAIRYSKSLLDYECEFDQHWNILTSKSNIKLLAVGAILVSNSLLACKILSDSGIETEVVAVTTVKPLDKTYLESISDDDYVITMEENQINGGFGSMVNTYLLNRKCKIFNLAVKDCFVDHASISQQLDISEMSANGIVNLVNKFVS